MNKSTMMENFDQLNTVGIKKDEAFRFALDAEQSRDFSKTLNAITVGLSSGTSGNRGIFLASERERELWAGAILAKLVPDLLTRSHRVGLFLRADSPLYNSVKSRRLSFHFFDLKDNIDAHIRHLNTQCPDIIIAPGSVLKSIAEHAASLHYRPSRFIACAEVLYPDAQAAVMAAFNKEVEQIYQCTEGFLACHQQGVLRFNEDIVHIEPQWIDDEQTRFRPIITDFRRTSQPIIRYVLDDIIHVGKDRDSGFKRIERIEGRCDDILTPIYPDGTNAILYPDFIVRAIVFAMDPSDFRITQRDSDRLHIESDEPFSAKIEEEIKRYYHEHGYRIPQFTHGSYARKSTDKNRRVVNQSAR